MTRRLLVAYAHPDDESFGIGALLAKYAAEGVEVTLICSTNGDVGSVSEDKLKGYDSVGALRLAELQCAAEVIGFKEVITWGYRDSGMMGSDDNNHPDCLWCRPTEEITEKMIEVMRQVRPHVVITFDPFGGYGHPDHIKMHHATLAAFQALQSEALHPQKLYYASFPKFMIRVGVTMMKLAGKDPRRAGVNQDLDFQRIIDETLPTHTRVDVRKYFEQGEKAAACHASQAGPQLLIPGARFLMRQAMAYSSFTRAYPEPRPGERMESDLFIGVREDAS